MKNRRTVDRRDEAHLSVTVHDDGAGDAGHVVIAPTGDVDVATEPEFWHCLEAAIDRAGTVTVDLAAIDFMDSTGLNALVRAVQHARQREAQLVVRSPRPQVRRLFEITGIDGLLGLEPDG